MNAETCTSYEGQRQRTWFRRGMQSALGAAAVAAIASVGLLAAAPEAGASVQTFHNGWAEPNVSYTGVYQADLKVVYAASWNVAWRYRVSRQTTGGDLDVVEYWGVTVAGTMRGPGKPRCRNVLHTRQLTTCKTS